jgi:hypothetical protein
MAWTCATALEEAKPKWRKERYLLSPWLTKLKRAFVGSIRDQSVPTRLFADGEVAPAAL